MTKVYTAFGVADARAITGAPCVIVGGTSLLRSFFEEVANLAACAEIWICSPFVDGDAASLQPYLTSIANPEIALNFITASDTAIRTVWSALTPLPWRKFTFGLYEGWHAKIYLALGRDQGRICLMGSHNFTEAGANRNFEAGVLLISYGTDDVAGAVFDVRTELEHALRGCNQIYNAQRQVHDPI